jgi:glycosyltransferase involved in cell wall biosynthesis
MQGNAIVIHALRLRHHRDCGNPASTRLRERAGSLIPSTTMEPAPDISLIIPCRNEARHIGPFLESLGRQDLGGYTVEILIADGMSDDGTREVLSQLGAKDPRIRAIDNPEEIVSTGLNRLIRCARGDVVIRCDVHTEYDAHYVRRCAEVLQRTRADNVGGPWRAAGKTRLQRAIALAFQSPFASGGARSHDPTYEGEVDSVYLGCWRRETLERLGLFDEELVRNQDDELSLRIRRSGGRVWQSPEIQSTYYPRASIRALFRQYMQYGYWKIRVIQKHKIPASIRHLVPGGFVFATLALGLLSIFSKTALVFFCALMALYLSCNVLSSVMVAASAHAWEVLPLLPPVFAAYHFGYGSGFLRGIIDFVILGKNGDPAFRRITR